ncbi:MAG: hypothetical protein H0X37_17705 [Herpetosiphonaceae bacterium]|nr:hypothetical protein [Herpetosiphonaceae bacterium]
MRHLVGHHFVHITDTALRSTKNGALLREVASGYDVFLTTDHNIPFQQNLQQFPLAFVVIHAVSNKLEDVLPFIPSVLVALDRIAQSPIIPGDLCEVGATSSRS